MPQVIGDQCDPVFDETLEYSGRLNELRIRRLELQVVSKKTFARNPVLGMVSGSPVPRLHPYRPARAASLQFQIPIRALIGQYAPSVT